MTPDRRPHIAANWKMWGTRAEARSYVERFVGLVPPEQDRPAEIVLCVPFTALDVCAEGLRGTGIRVAAQNMHQEESGAYTGEISAPMLTEIGVDAVVLGHSERRQYDCESDKALQEKVPAALEAGLQPILCVGETEEEREAGETQRKLRHQVQEDLAELPDERLGDVVIAYEPIWAIGTGHVATPEQAQDAIAFVRALVGDRSEDAAQAVRVLYGGSVKPDNAQEILAQRDVDGALVGGASLDPAAFAEIVGAAAGQ
jgi:triosephosphate isomerase (TIM)